MDTPLRSANKGSNKKCADGSNHAKREHGSKSSTSETPRNEGSSPKPLSQERISQEDQLNYDDLSSSDLPSPYVWPHHGKVKRQDGMGYDLLGLIPHAQSQQPLSPTPKLSSIPNATIWEYCTDHLEKTTYPTSPTDLQNKDAEMGPLDRFLREPASERSAVVEEALRFGGSVAGDIEREAVSKKSGCRFRN